MMLHKAVDVFEEMAKMDFRSSANVRFIADLRDNMLNHLTPSVVDAVLVNMDVTLSSYDPEDQHFKRLIVAITQIVVNAWNQFLNYSNPHDWLPKISIKLDF